MHCTQPAKRNPTQPNPQLEHPELDNPDQRIAGDCGGFVSFTVGILNVAGSSLFSILSFAGVLYSISPQLLVFLAAYAALGTGLTTRLFGRALTRLNAACLRSEGDLRFALSRMREHAESVAFYGGAAAEAEHSEGLLLRLRAALLARIACERGLNIVVELYGHMTSFLPMMVLARPYFAGEIEMGEISQAGMAYATVLRALSLCTDNMDGLAAFAAESARLSALLRALSAADKAGAEPVASEPADIELADSRPREGGDRGDCIKHAALPPGSAEILRCAGLSVAVPGLHRRVLWSGLDLALLRGDSLLVVGPSGIGKSSLLRVLAGLWTSGSGAVWTAPREELFFLPQVPYMPQGSLRAAVEFPSGRGEAHSDEALHAALGEAGLSKLPERVGGLEAHADWAGLLSVGEQQRLAFARAFLRRPAAVFLDEATAALDLAGEAELCTALARGGCTTLISVGHRPTLARFHSRVLELEGGGVGASSVLCSTRLSSRRAPPRDSRS